MNDGVGRGMRELLATRDVKIGHYVGEFATSGIGYILKAAGCDFVAFDMEHSGLGFETMRTVLRFAEAAGLAAMVRPPSKRSHDIARTLDIGAEAVMMQMVGTAEEAREIVASMKYPPTGKRGVITEHYFDRFAGGPVGASLAAANRATALFVLIETGQGVANADAIAAVDGVDCLYVGHLDLSVDLGIAGEYGHPRMVEAVTRVAGACRNSGKSFAWTADSVGRLEDMRRLGADFIFYGSDTLLLRDALAAGTGEIRRRLAVPR
ncbi:MAG: HpcH/HpaI aldolase family protein [Alphaproteobacteria bacterium]